MSDQPVKPVVVMFHGDDEYAMQQAVHEMEARLGDDPTTRSLNLSHLDGRTTSLEEIHNAAYAIPFLGERRLVVLSHPLDRLAGTDARQRFLALLDGVPESTALVLLLEDEFRSSGRDRGWQMAQKHAWLFDWRSKSGNRVYYRILQQPSLKEMTAWVQSEASRQGGAISSQAAQVLASRVGNDTRIASQEITKLLQYLNFERTAEPKDVEAVCINEGPQSLFEMIDAVAAGNVSTALRLLHALLETEDATALFAMLIRQFRLLIQAREILDLGGNAGLIASGLHQVDFVAQKLERQARRFTMPQLKSNYRRLLEIDLAAKTSQMPLETALDDLIARLG